MFHVSSVVFLTPKWSNSLAADWKKEGKGELEWFHQTKAKKCWTTLRIRRQFFARFSFDTSDNKSFFLFSSSLLRGTAAAAVAAASAVSAADPFLLDKVSIKPISDPLHLLICSFLDGEITGQFDWLITHVAQWLKKWSVYGTVRSTIDM